MTTLKSLNPADYSVIGEVNVSSAQDIAEKVQLAHAAKKPWKTLGAKKRAELLRPLHNTIEKRSHEISELTSLEIGKPISQSIEDMEFTLDYLQAFVDDAPGYLENEITVSEKSKDQSAFHQIIYEPIGVTACIVPWNYPLSNFIWGVIPNLIAGNPVVFKHSEECPLIGKLIEEMMDELQLPDGVFSEVYGDGSVGHSLIEQNIDLIWFTGSSHTGKELFEIAAKKGIKSVLEMGGSDPAIIFEDAKILDFDRVISRVYSQRFENCGQICSAAKRLIVHDSIFQDVLDRLVNYLSTVKIGDPLDPNTQLGPLAAERQLQLLESQIKDAVALGAKIVCGGKRPENHEGAYYLPTLLSDIKPTMRVWKEETFGPVLPIVTFSTEEEAIALANDTIFGLSSLIFTSDSKRARRVAAQIEAGCVDINFGSHWRPCNPFGGYKASGVGREHGKFGFQELTQVKVIAE
ncbi:MAG: aldehyde dehydrogenase family protein [Gammaproteobacteria bacterium]|nr:aldehyde dehydrogenase family protein [Gammaproteobacteria bacterium]